MKANDIRPIPLQYTATTSEASYRRLEAAMLQMGHLRNALIRHRNSARGSHRFAFNFKLQNAHLTDLHRHDPEFNPYARRLLESVAKEVNKSYRTYFNNTDTGRPQTASPYRNHTLEISKPANQHLKFSKKGWASIRVKGLPVIRFRNDKRLPENEQPKVIRITLKPRRLDVSLTYHSEPKDIGEPTKDSVGIDPGIKQNITAVSNDGAMWQTPGFNSRPPSQDQASFAPQDAEAARRSPKARQSAVHQSKDPHRENQAKVSLDRPTLARLPQHSDAAPQS